MDPHWQAFFQFSVYYSKNFKKNFLYFYEFIFIEILRKQGKVSFIDCSAGI